MKTVYFISGLGADERAFSRLKLPGVEMRHVRWLEPTGPNESMAAYAARMCEQIATTNPILVGLSFGGMMALEMATQLPCERVILISSIKSKHEKPWFMRLLRWLPLHKLISGAWLSHPNRLTWFFFGIGGRPNLQQLMREYMSTSSPAFIRWAISRIVHWNGAGKPQQLHHLHGTRDRVFTAGNLSGVTWIDGGSHFMVWTRAEEVSQVLLKWIQP